MKKLKVFHGLINYGTQAGLFAKELRENGIESISVTQADSFKRLIDIELLHGGNVFQKAYKHTWNILKKFYWFFKYNTFHFYFGNSLFPKQIDLPFYKFFGKKIVFHYLGKDVKLYKQSIERYKISNMAYSSGKPEEAIKMDEKITKRLLFETKYAAMQFVCSPIYSEFVKGSVLLPLAIDLAPYKFSPVKAGDTLKILHAPTSRLNKGTPFIIDAVERLQTEGYKIDFKICENITHVNLLKEYEKCDVFIDQVLGGYGTAAIEAMAFGKPTISYLRDIHFNDKTFPDGVPIIRAHKDNIYDVLKDVLNNKESLWDISFESRKFVEKNHDVKVLTKKLINYYRHVWEQ